MLHVANFLCYLKTWAQESTKTIQHSFNNTRLCARSASDETESEFESEDNLPLIQLLEWRKSPQNKSYALGEN